MKQILTITQVKRLLHKLAEQKNRPSYELCTAKQVKFALENGLDHPLIEELRGLIQERTIPQDITHDKKVSHARLVKHRVYPTAEQAKDVHGDIRHLEIRSTHLITRSIVHGDIRHLERFKQELSKAVQVHGDIRHLENKLMSL